MSVIWDSRNSGLWYKCAAQSDFYLKLHIANITVQAFWKAWAVIIINPISFSCPFVWLCVTGCVTDWLVVHVWVGEWVGEGPYELGVCVCVCVHAPAGCLLSMLLLVTWYSLAVFIQSADSSFHLRTQTHAQACTYLWCHWFRAPWQQWARKRERREEKNREIFLHMRGWRCYK